MSLRELAPGLRYPRKTVHVWPEQVAAVNYIAQTAALGTTTIYAVREPGIYRITMIAQTTTGGDAITVQPNVLFTDSVGARTEPVGTALSLNSTGRTTVATAPMDYIFEAVGASYIQISSTLSGGRVSSVHNLRVVLERLA